MLLILRTISVGGVLLAITILGLALIPPGRSHVQFAADDQPARGALIDRRAHPEWRQFLILSALRRADELDRLRGLPGMPSGLADVSNDTPAATAKTARRLAGLPVAHDQTEPEDETGSINVAPSATIPIDIGETSSVELPVTPVEEKPPVARSPVVGATTSEAGAAETPAPADVTEPPLFKVSALALPEQAKPVVVIRKHNVRKPAAKKPAETAVSMPPPFNILQAFFASLSGKQNASSEQPAKSSVVRPSRVKPRQTAAVR